MVSKNMANEEVLKKILWLFRYGLSRSSQRSTLIHGIMQNEEQMEFLRLCFLYDKDEFMLPAISTFSSITYGENSDILKFVTDKIIDVSTHP